jgi:hypothetical protein
MSDDDELPTHRDEGPLLGLGKEGGRQGPVKVPGPIQVKGASN